MLIRNPILARYGQPFILFLVLSAISLVVYSNVLSGEFCSDDYPLLVDNPGIRDLKNWAGIWHSAPTRFLVVLSFALNYHWGGLDVLGYHLVNILLHGGCAFFVYRFFEVTLRTPAMRERLVLKGAWISAAAALLFLTHPIATQAVSFITQRGTLLSTLLYLLALVGYGQSRLCSSREMYGIALLAMALGAVTKESIITLPVALLVYDVIFFPGEPQKVRALLKRLWPFVVVAGLMPLILAQEQRGSVFELHGQVQRAAFRYDHLLSEINVFRTYLRLLFFPVNLTHDYDYPLSHHLGEGGTLYSAGLLVVVFGAAVRLWKKVPLYSFAVFFFFITLLIQTAVAVVVNRNLLFEHWLYLPLVAFVMVAAYFLAVLARTEKVFKGMLFIVIFIFSAMTYNRNVVWQDEISFWEDGLRKTPRYPIVHFAAGNAYARKGFYDQAIVLYRRALALNSQRPGNERLAKEPLAKVYNNLGLAYFKTRQDAASRQAYTMALSFNPNYGEAHNNLGLLEFEEGQYEKAFAEFQRALEFEGPYPYGYYHLSRAALALGRKDEAKRYWRQAQTLCCQGRCTGEAARDIAGLTLSVMTPKE